MTGLSWADCLQTLDLSKNKELTWKACFPLGELLNTSYKLSYPYPKHAIVACGHCRLSALILNDLSIGDKGIQVLMEKIGLNNCLQILSVQNGGITRNSAGAISMMLTENITLQVRMLMCCQLASARGKGPAAQLNELHDLLSAVFCHNRSCASDGISSGPLVQSLSESHSVQTALFSAWRSQTMGFQTTAEVILPLPFRRMLSLRCVTLVLAS